MNNAANTSAPIFYYNGIKDAKGERLQKCNYSDSELRSFPTGTITIYASNYKRFSAKVNDCFDVQNDSDSMTDYFANDTIRVQPTHPLYPQVLAACQQQNAKFAAKSAARAARWAA